MSTLWFRYFFRRQMTLFLGCLFLLFFLFVLTDLMGHVKDILDHRTDKGMWVQYYLALFSRRFDTLVPFALLISSTLLLTSIARKNEMIPLLNGGLSLARQTRPFFAVAILAMLFMWSNAQWFFPQAIRTHDHVIDTDFGREKETLPNGKKMGTLYLRDGSKLFFQRSNPLQKKLYDVFWMAGHDTIFHIEELSYMDERLPEGYLIDVIERGKANVVLKTKTITQAPLPEIKISEEDVSMATYPAKHLSLVQLLKMVLRMHHSSSEKATDIFITFMLKCLTPLTCLLTLMLPIPYCLAFDRKKHPVLFLFFFLAALFIFQLTIQTSTILARIPGAPSFLLLLLPWALVGFCLQKKLKHFFS